MLKVLKAFAGVCPVLPSPPIDEGPVPAPGPGQFSLTVQNGRVVGNRDDQEMKTNIGGCYVPAVPGFSVY